MNRLARLRQEFAANNAEIKNAKAIRNAQNVTVSGLKRSIRHQHEVDPNRPFYVAIVERDQVPAAADKVAFLNTVGETTTSWLGGLGTTGIEYDPQASTMERSKIANIDPALGATIAKAEEHGHLTAEDSIMVFRPRPIEVNQIESGPSLHQ